jgi:S-adenosylmethionine-dependent methyltransferase
VTEDRWAPIADQFVDGHYGSLRGRVRTHVIDRHLRWHLPPPPARLVDVGGGAGHQSIPLARDGYQITIVDPSSAMLERAERLIAEEPPEVAARLRLACASGEQASEALDGERFSGVLCHGVMMYVDELSPFVAALGGLALEGGVVSIVTKNVDNLAIRPALEGKWSEALEAFDSDHQQNGLGVDTRGDSVDGISDMLEQVGVQRIAWYGVRLFTDGWTRELPKNDPESDVLAVELEASRRDPYRQMSRLFHIVGVKL